MRILIADDHAIVRKGIIELLKTEYASAEIKETSNGEEAIQMAKNNDWDLIILDISMPLKNGIIALKEIRASGIKTPVLMLSMQPEDQYSVRASNAGASGFVNKESAMDELIKAARKIMAGGKYFSDETNDKINSSRLENKGEAGSELLSEREMQVLKMLASGKIVTEIAQEIGLSVTTISTYRMRILEKLSLSNNAELTRFAMDNGLV